MRDSDEVIRREAEEATAEVERATEELVAARLRLTWALERLSRISEERFSVANASGGSDSPSS